VDPRSFDLPRRALNWKRRVQDQLALLQQQVNELAAAHAEARAQLADRDMRLLPVVETLQRQVDELAAAHAETRARLADHDRRLLAFVEILPSAAALLSQLTAPAARCALARRDDALLVLLLGDNDALSLGGGADATGVAEAIVAGDIRRVLVKRFADLGPPAPHPAGEALLRSIRLLPEHAKRIFGQEAPAGEASRETDGDSHARCETLCKLLAERPDLVDFAAGHVAKAAGEVRPIPFDRPDMLPRLIPAEPKRRSALFLHNSYYHFNCLADGLRRRGWDALTVAVEDPNSAHQQFYHGEDVNLFDPDRDVMREKTRAFFCTVPERFGALHFYGAGRASLFPELFGGSERPIQPPFDFFELRRHRTIIGYMPSGCLDGAPRSAIRALSGNICARCVWETRPDICSDQKSLAWAKRLEQVCDWIGIEGDWPAAPRTGPGYVHGPVATALDADAWRPDLVIPDDLKVARQPGTILVYHAVGNYKTRRVGERDIKGTAAVLAAIDQLKAEGLPVQLCFATDVPSRSVRFIQVQADVVVDQLNYGRTGANARESMMLGRPVIVRLDPRQGGGLPSLRSIEEAPLVDATEQNVTHVLRELVLNPQRRADLGRRARKFAVAWHGSDACAERYEKVIDRVRSGLAPDSPDLYPAPPPA
jgi:hypothetical protein